jgi:hypothetical protein
VTMWSSPSSIRLGRETIDLLEIADTTAKKGGGFKSLAEPWADTGAQADLHRICDFTECASSHSEQRQREGIEAESALPPIAEIKADINLRRCGPVPEVATRLTRSAGRCGRLSLYEWLRHLTRAVDE